MYSEKYKEHFVSNINATTSAQEDLQEETNRKKVNDLLAVAVSNNDPEKVYTTGEKLSNFISGKVDLFRIVDCNGTIMPVANNVYTFDINGGYTVSAG